MILIKHRLVGIRGGFRLFSGDFPPGNRGGEELIILKREKKEVLFNIVIGTNSITCLGFNF